MAKPSRQSVIGLGIVQVKFRAVSVSSCINLECRTSELREMSMNSLIAFRLGFAGRFTSADIFFKPHAVKEAKPFTQPSLYLVGTEIGTATILPAISILLHIHINPRQEFPQAFRAVFYLPLRQFLPVPVLPA